MTDIVQKCLSRLADQVGLTENERRVFLAVVISENKIQEKVADELGLNPSALRNAMSRVYDKFHFHQGSKGKLKILKSYVNGQCSIQSSVPTRLYTAEMPTVHQFLGREEELRTLVDYIESNCRLVSLLGIKGIGKTVLAVKLVESVKNEFEVVIWQDLRSISTFEDLLESLIRSLSNTNDILSPSIHRINWLINHFKEHKCLLILDDVTHIIHNADASRQCCNFFRQIANQHDPDFRSFILITGNELPLDLTGNFHYHEIRVEGLDIDNVKKLLQSQDDPLFVDPPENPEEIWESFVAYYGGNPKALMIAAAAIRRLHDGDIVQFIKPKTRCGLLPVHDAIKSLLDEQFNLLTDLEKQIMFWLAIGIEPMYAEEINENIIFDDNKRNSSSGVDNLLNKSLIEKRSSTSSGKRRGFTQVPIIMDYVTDILVCNVCDEIESGDFNILNSHSLVAAQAKDYVRDIQLRRILEPIAEKLIQLHKGNKSVIKTRLDKILLKWRTENFYSGYLGGNIVNLFRQLKIDISGYDLSELPIWQANFQGMDLQDVNLKNSDLFRSNFSENLSSVLSVSFSPDGLSFATGEANGDIRIWDARNHTSLQQIKGHNSQVWSINYSPDGKTLASGSEDGVTPIKLLNTTDEQNQLFPDTQSIEPQCVRSIVFSPDNRILAVAGNNGIEVRDRNTNKLHHRLPANEIYSISFISDNILASGSQDGTISLWNVDSGENLHQCKEHSDTVRSIASIPKKSLFASGSEDGTVRVWIENNGNSSCLYSYSYPQTKHVYAVAFHQDEEMLAIGAVEYDTDGLEIHTVRLWNILTKKVDQVLRGHGKQIRALAFSPDPLERNLLISTGDDCKIKLWNVYTGKCIKTLHGYTNRIWSITSDNVCGVFASGGEDNKLHIWSSTSWQCEKILPGHSDWIWSVAFSPDGTTVASSSEDNEIRLWNLKTDDCKLLKKHTERVRAVAFSPNGKFLASGSNDRSVILWDIETGEPYKVFDEESGGHQRRVLSVAFNYDGSLIASSSRDTTIRLWSTDSETYSRTLKGHQGEVHSIAFTNGGKNLVSGSFDTTLKLWSLEDDEPEKTVCTLRGHQGGVLSVCSFPNDKFLASSGHDQKIKIWDLETGDFLYDLSGHEGPVESIAISRDAKILLSSSQDQTIKIWDLKSRTCMRTLTPEKPYRGMKIAGVKRLSVPEQALLDLGAVKI
jgi:WD40 repeat protein/DNA-binding CsgD family transcriptional regulator